MNALSNPLDGLALTLTEQLAGEAQIKGRTRRKTKEGILMKGKWLRKPRSREQNEKEYQQKKMRLSTFFYRL